MVHYTPSGVPRVPGGVSRGAAVRREVAGGFRRLAQWRRTESGTQAMVTRV